MPIILLRKNLKLVLPADKHLLKVYLLWGHALQGKDLGCLIIGWVGREKVDRDDTL